MKTRYSVSLIFSLLTMVLLIPTASWALPRFALRDGTPYCGTCHTDPSGGGKRNAYGQGGSFASSDLWVYWNEDWEPEPTKGKINKYLSLGSDIRLLYVAGQKDSKVARPNSFFLMQADGYIEGRLGDYVTLYTDLGVGSTYEAFGMVKGKVLGGKGYVKAGHFEPAFGLRMDDHNYFTRAPLGFAQTYKDTGVEFGYVKGRFVAQLGVYNGDAGTFDVNTQKATFFNIGYGLSTGPLKWIGGVSTGLNPAGTDKGNALASVWGGVTAWNISLLQEVAGNRSYQNGLKKPPTKIATMTELSYLPIDGLEILTTYGQMDNDLYTRNGIERMVELGVDFYPLPNMDILLKGRLHITETPDPADPTINLPDPVDNDVILEIHTYF